MGRTKLDVFYFIGSASIILVALYVNAVAFHRAWQGEVRSLDSYSYLGDDYPPSLIPLSSLPFNSSMIVEDTYHYSSGSKDDAEHESLLPNGSGIVRLGPDHRPFEVTMYHQIRCLNLLQKAMVTEPKDVENRTSISNCFNYIRQTLMCAASIRVEPFKPDPVIGSDKIDGLDLEYKCRDWSRVREVVAQNH